MSTLLNAFTGYSGSEEDYPSPGHRPMRWCPEMMEESSPISSSETIPTQPSNAMEAGVEDQAGETSRMEAEEMASLQERIQPRMWGWCEIEEWGGGSSPDRPRAGCYRAEVRKAIAMLQANQHRLVSTEACSAWLSQAQALDALPTTPLANASKSMEENQGSISEAAKPFQFGAAGGRTFQDAQTQTENGLSFLGLLVSVLRVACGRIYGLVRGRGFWSFLKTLVEFLFLMSCFWHLCGQVDNEDTIEEQKLPRQQPLTCPILAEALVGLDSCYEWLDPVWRSTMELENEDKNSLAVERPKADVQVEVDNVIAVNNHFNMWLALDLMPYPVLGLLKWLEFIVGSSVLVAIVYKY